MVPHPQYLKLAQDCSFHASSTIYYAVDLNNPVHSLHHRKLNIMTSILLTAGGTPLTQLTFFPEGGTK